MGQYSDKHQYQREGTEALCVLCRSASDEITLMGDDLGNVATFQHRSNPVVAGLPMAVTIEDAITLLNRFPITDFLAPITLVKELTQTKISFAEPI